MSPFKNTLAAVAVLATSAVSAQNLVQNGSFDQVANSSGVLQTKTDNYGLTSARDTGNFDFHAVGWTNQDFLAIVYGSGIGDSVYPLTKGSTREDMALIGPNSPTKATNNGLPAASPAGGNYYGADAGATFAGALTQTVSGMVVGQQYTLSFWWAGAQATGASNTAQALNMGWDVSLGSDVQASVQTNIAYKGFSGWTQASYTFTATSASELLSFLPTSTAGSPPMSLLDGVSIVAVPEPQTWAMLAAGLGLVAFVQRRRSAQR
ncbi:PEP-CTERM sorting domain-containing protein [Pelomonas sp. KK5]|uniref:PEP-CTERM sorting domain-containing protein n=1 Tax=Pelomonas sp. KK5 TaxID=1855730 RepID=UPI00097C8D0D|nr:PEP-CTERM sorting domain-containing protein [Pelomonas sp. KK5]